MAQREQPKAPPIAPDLVGERLWDARRLAKARADATLDVVIVETRERARTVVRQDPAPGEPLGEDRSIRVEVTQPSWVRHLPGIYQDSDEEHADFLRRFLSIQQHLALQVEEKLESIHTFFDPREAPEAFLPWLGSWVAVSLHEGWSAERRREIILRAVELYRQRGTARGLEVALQLFADVKAEIVEFSWPYPGFVIGRHAVVGHRSTIARPVLSTQCFVVKLPATKSAVSRETLRTIHAVIEAEKPAHAQHAIEFLEEQASYEPVSFLRLGQGQRIGVDTRIGGCFDEPDKDDDAMAVGAG